ncbi:MAG TPA: HAD-IIB family hydrolase [Sandaracinaceae bacterium LLY-WYZ-13_1]|nr:HAD-IIB family hydrolase [Sandaracinaceae bacterium LLY-WYZ-13_1]
MRALGAMSPATRAGLRGVIFDVDDTLTTHGTLTAEAYASLFSLRDAGLRLIAVTGRPLGWTDAMAASWPVDLAVGENGAGWAWRRGRGLELGYFDDEATRRRHASLLAEVRSRVAARFEEIAVAGDQPARRCDLAFDVGEEASVPAARVAELVDTIEAAGARATVSSVHAHAVPGGWDKARGVVRAARDALGEDLDADRAAWLFVGDSGNDAAAFAHFEHTVGVANVRAHLPRLEVPPRWVTEAARGAGFVELAAALTEGRDG